VTLAELERGEVPSAEIIPAEILGVILELPIDWYTSSNAAGVELNDWPEAKGRRTAEFPTLRSAGRTSPREEWGTPRFRFPYAVYEGGPPTLYNYDALGNLLCVEQHGGVSGTGCQADAASDSSSPWRVRR
jgi:hypothetical protein